MLGVFNFGGAGSLRLARACCSRVALHHSALSMHELYAAHPIMRATMDAMRRMRLDKTEEEERLVHLSEYRILEVKSLSKCLRLHALAVMREDLGYSNFKYDVADSRVTIDDSAHSSDTWHVPIGRLQQNLEYTRGNSSFVDPIYF
jgi:hypothetical protein